MQKKRAQQMKALWKSQATDGPKESANELNQEDSQNKDEQEQNEGESPSLRIGQLDLAGKATLV